MEICAITPAMPLVLPMVSATGEEPELEPAVTATRTSRDLSVKSASLECTDRIANTTAQRVAWHTVSVVKAHLEMVRARVRRDGEVPSARFAMMDTTAVNVNTLVLNPVLLTENAPTDLQEMESACLAKRTSLETTVSYAQLKTIMVLSANTHALIFAWKEEIV